MLKITDLKTFAETQQQAIARINSVVLVASDDKAGKYLKSIRHKNNESTLIVVLPNHQSVMPDEDTPKMRNGLIFMLVHKTDAKGGYKAEETAFITTQEDILALLKNIIALVQKDTNCLFRNVDVSSFAIEPISDYFQTNGYSLEFSNISCF